MIPNLWWRQRNVKTNTASFLGCCFEAQIHQKQQTDWNWVCFPKIYIYIFSVVFWFVSGFFGQVVLCHRIFVDGGGQTNGTATWCGDQECTSKISFWGLGRTWKPLKGEGIRKRNLTNFHFEVSGTKDAIFLDQSRTFLTCHFLFVCDQVQLT